MLFKVLFEDFMGKFSNEISKSEQNNFKDVIFYKNHDERKYENIIDEIESLLSGSRITMDRARFFRGAEDNSNKIFLRGTDKLGEKRFYLRPEKLHNELKSGGTFILDSINEFKGCFSDSCELIAKKIHCESSANLYVSYSSIESFGRHKDDHGVIVQQLVGTKEWFFDQEESITLNSGDFLYVPKGTYHNPVCDSTLSVHITYSIHKTNMADFSTWLYKKTLENELNNINIENESDIEIFLKESGLLTKFIESKNNSISKIKSDRLRMFPR